MYYAEFKPRPQLRQCVQTIWVFECESVSDPALAADSDLQRIVPDGHAELILHYGDQFHEIVESSNTTTPAQRLRQSRLLFAGQILQPLLLQPGSACGVIGVRFHPAGARALLDIAMHETTDLRLDLTDVWGSESQHLQDEVHSQRTVDARVAVMENFLVRKLDASTAQPDAVIATCVALIEQSAGQMSIDALAAKVDLSGRQLERRFRDHVGIPPRLLASILRFRRVFDSIEHGAAPSARWTDAALSTGYFDQAHMNRDFKRFAGLSPQAFYRELSGLSAAMVGSSPHE